MSNPNVANINYQHELDHMAPATKHALLGTVLVSVLAQVNALVVDVAALHAKYVALLGHLDTANVAGIGNANTANYSPAAQTSAAPTPLGG